MDELFARAGVACGPAFRRRRRVRVMPAPWRRNDSWSPQEAADELYRRRAELVGQLRRRGESRGVPLHAQAEIVDDAITAVVMSPRGVVNEHHLLGAFWLAVDHRCRRYREGSSDARLGARLDLRPRARTRRDSARRSRWTPSLRLAARRRGAFRFRARSPARSRVRPASPKRGSRTDGGDSI
jgi:hypothetical protein